MAQLILKNGHLYTLDFIQPTQIGKACQLSDIKMIIEDMTQENLSGATVKGDETIAKLGNVKLNSFSVEVKQNKFYITIFFDEITETEIELAKQRAETEAVAGFIALGLQNANVKDVIKWRKFLENWQPNKFPYKKGERFKHNDQAWEVKENVTSSPSNPPEKTERYYKLLTEADNKPANDVFEPWDEKKTYSKGDKVIARGIKFISNIDNNKGNEPGFGNAWDYKK